MLASPIYKSIWQNFLFTFSFIPAFSSTYCSIFYENNYFLIYFLINSLTFSFRLFNNFLLLSTFHNHQKLSPFQMCFFIRSRKLLRLFFSFFLNWWHFTNSRWKKKQHNLKRQKKKWENTGSFISCLRPFSLPLFVYVWIGTIFPHSFCIWSIAIFFFIFRTLIMRAWLCMV